MYWDQNMICHDLLNALAMVRQSKLPRYTTLIQRENILSRVLSLMSLVFLSVLCGGARTSYAADGDYLFPVGVKYNDGEWTDITPSEAVRLVDEALAKHPKYGSGRMRLLIYLANKFVSGRDVMIQLFGEIRKTDKPARMRETTARIRRQPKDITQRLNWSEVTITEDGDDVIEKCEKWSSATTSSVYLSTDKVKIIYDGMLRQADVALPGLQNRMLVNTFTSFRIGLKPAKEQYVLSAAKTSDYVKLVRGSDGGRTRTTVFSLRDGSVLHEYATSPEGELIEESWQGESKKWTGGVRYPTSLLHFRYTNSAVTYVKAVAVKHAEFNVRIEPIDFEVAIPAGTTVVDVRDGDPAVIRVKEAIGNLATALDDGLLTIVAPARHEMDASSTSRLRIALILLNVIVIVLVLVVIVRRRATRSHT